jgi:hypothetical protein
VIVKADLVHTTDLLTLEEGRTSMGKRECCETGKCSGDAFHDDSIGFIVGRLEQFDILSCYLRVLLLSKQLDLSTPIAEYGYFEGCPLIFANQE